MSSVCECVIRVFVYGTLKRGYWNHAAFCAQAQRIEMAVTWGRLYDLPYGFPGLQVSDATVLLHGSADPLADAQQQAQIETPEFIRPKGGWGLVHGELITFAHPREDVPPLDNLEGFTDSAADLYQRVLVPAHTPQAPTTAWLYRMRTLPENSVLLADGLWEPLPDPAR